jgi:hypothetical protein
MIIKLLLINILIVCSLSGCAYLTRPVTLEVDVPEGPPEFRAGWHDGCSSALTAGGFLAGRFNKMSMGTGIYQHSSIYQTAWGSGWFACVTASGGYTGMPSHGSAPLQ